MTNYPDLPQDSEKRANEMRSLKDILSPRLKQALKAIGGNLSDDLSPHYECRFCEDRGLVSYDLPTDHPFFGKLHACTECQKGRDLLIRRWHAQLRNARLPAMYQNFNFESWASMPDAAKKGKRLAYITASLFVQNADCKVDLLEVHERAGLTFDRTLVRNSIIFQGPNGVGKTGMAASIVNELAATGRAVLYMRTQDFLDSITSRFNVEEPPTSYDVVQLLVNAPVLVLDEFNVAKVGEWLQGQMETVIRNRYANERPTVLTCNASADELTEMWGIRATHVLFSMAHWIPMGGQVLRDHRQLTEPY